MFVWRELKSGWNTHFTNALYQKMRLFCGRNTDYDEASAHVPSICFIYPDLVFSSPKTGFYMSDNTWTGSEQPGKSTTGRLPAGVLIGCESQTLAGCLGPLGGLDVVSATRLEMNLEVTVGGTLEEPDSLDGSAQEIQILWIGLHLRFSKGSKVTPLRTEKSKETQPFLHLQAVLCTVPQATGKHPLTSWWQHLVLCSSRWINNLKAQMKDLEWEEGSSSPLTVQLTSCWSFYELLWTGWESSAFWSFHPHLAASRGTAAC